MDGPHFSDAGVVEAGGLSPRQHDCLERVAQGETSSQIATALDLSVRTVDQYIAQACLRLGVRRRASAVARAVRLGLIAPSS